MEIDLITETSSKRLNKAVAITVVTLTAFMSVSKIKDDNIVQAMQSDKADIVSTWNEYHTRQIDLSINQHVIDALLLNQNEIHADSMHILKVRLETEVAEHYLTLQKLIKKAQTLSESYEAKSFRDDQFDIADAGFAIALSLSAVAALTGLWSLLFVSWSFGGASLLMAISAFNSWPIHPDYLIGIFN